MTKPDSILLMWITSPMLKNAIELIKHYGFSYSFVLFHCIKTKNIKL